jgi:hypothetical protein
LTGSVAVLASVISGFFAAVVEEDVTVGGLSAVVVAELDGVEVVEAVCALEQVWTQTLDGGRDLFGVEALPTGTDDLDGGVEALYGGVEASVGGEAAFVEGEGDFDGGMTLVMEVAGAFAGGEDALFNETDGLEVEGTRVTTCVEDVCVTTILLTDLPQLLLSLLTLVRLREDQSLLTLIFPGAALAALLTLYPVSPFLLVKTYLPSEVVKDVRPEVCLVVVGVSFTG